MYLLSPTTKSSSGAFAVENNYGEKVVYFFEEYDDALRYLGLLEAEDYPSMKIVKIEDNVALKACKLYDYSYVVIKPDDFVIPPKTNALHSKD